MAAGPTMFGERAREREIRDARSSTERYDSLRFPCSLFCIGGAVNNDRRFD